MCSLGWVNRYKIFRFFIVFIIRQDHKYFHKSRNKLIFTDPGKNREKKLYDKTVPLKHTQSLFFLFLQMCQKCPKSLKKIKTKARYEISTFKLILKSCKKLLYEIHFPKIGTCSCFRRSKHNSHFSKKNILVIELEIHLTVALL